MMLRRVLSAAAPEASAQRRVTFIASTEYKLLLEMSQSSEASNSGWRAVPRSSPLRIHDGTADGYSASPDVRWRLANLLLLLGPLLLPDADALDLRLLARGGVGLRERGDDVGSDQDVEDQDGDDGGDRVAVVGAGTLEVSREDKPRTRR